MKQNKEHEVKGKILPNRDKRIGQTVLSSVLQVQILVIGQTVLSSVLQVQILVSA